MEDSRNQAQTKKKNVWSKIYERRQRASLSDARVEADAVRTAIARISDSVDDNSPPALQSYAAGRLFEISNELPAAETAYRRVLAADPEMNDARVRLLIVLGKQGRIEDGIKIGHELLLKMPGAVFKSLVYEGPLSLCTLVGDLYRLAGNYAIATTMYREGAKLEGGAPYAVNQAVMTMVLQGQGAEAVQFVDAHSDTWKSELISSIVRLAQQSDQHLAIVREVAARANIAGMESMSLRAMYAVDPAP